MWPGSTSVTARVPTRRRPGSSPGRSATSPRPLAPPLRWAGRPPRWPTSCPASDTPCRGWRRLSCWRPSCPGFRRVGGQTAARADELSSIGRPLPWMALAVVLATFVLLFLAFGSLVLPLEAIVANILSLSAMYGVVTWIFADGHLSGLLSFTPNGTISPTIPVLMFAIMFGLSMDYEVFLLSRIRERYVATGDNTAAIASGLQRTGGVITSAALLLLIVIGMFSISSITFIKLLGVGMIVALILDATLVRMMLVPATMRLLGDANWWAPAPLRRLYARYGIREDDGPAPAAVAGAASKPARAS